MPEVRIKDFSVGADNPLLIIAGPCVIESRDIIFHVAEELKRITNGLGLRFVFKSSFDKANRTSISSFRGPGIDKGLKMLSDVKERYDIPVLSDIHSIEQVKPASEVLDVLQIPAFLCRQTDLIISASKTGKPVNVKKGQFLAPWDVKNIIEKFTSTGNHSLIITERGNFFGYNNLVVDFRSISIMRSFGYPVVFDVTHSLQLPGGMGKSSGGQREFAKSFAFAGTAVGVDGLFMEVHPEPDRALCDGPNMIKLSEVEDILKKVKQIDNVVK